MNAKAFVCLLIITFISGMTSLAYETLWQRILPNIIGATASSSVLVIIIFFIALSIGSNLRKCLSLPLFTGLHPLYHKQE